MPLTEAIDKATSPHQPHTIPFQAFQQQMLTHIIIPYSPCHSLILIIAASILLVHPYVCPFRQLVFDILYLYPDILYSIYTFNSSLLHALPCRQPVAKSTAARHATEELVDKFFLGI